MAECHEIVLTGCRPTPLASYLKALGILRLVSDQVDRSTAGCWNGDSFILRSKLNKGQIREFFLSGYAPTPIISPWSGRAGFLEGEDASASNRKGAVTVREVIESTGQRFAGYRTILDEANNVQVLSDLNKVRSKRKELEERKSKLKKQNRDLSENQVKELDALNVEQKQLKSQLLLSLRSEMSDLFLRWLDACYVLTSADQKIAPLLGSGGNEGSMDFSINHLSHLKDLIDPSTDQSTQLAESAINQSLFWEPKAISSNGNPGFLNPGVTNGPNMGTGFEGRIGDNPWNIVLMLEGIVLFAAAATKKSGSEAGSIASLPFIFETSHAGHGSIGSREKSVSEFWAPIWKQFAPVEELQALLSEGRTTVGRRTARNGLDMAKSVNSLGVDRGIYAFERYGFFERRGKGYSVGAPMGRFVVNQSATSRLIEELNDWLSTFQRFESGKGVAKRFVDLRRTLEEKLFLLASRHHTPADVQNVLAVLGKLQTAISRSDKAREKLDPIPQLSEHWAQAADDKSPAFHITCALAGLRGLSENPLPLRSQLFPIHHANQNNWLEKVNAKYKNDPACRIRLPIAHQRGLVSTLIALLQSRLSLPTRLGFTDKPLNSKASVGLTDLMQFLTNNEMDAKIASLLPGLSLCKIHGDCNRSAGEGQIHAAFALCKLALVPDATLRRLGLLQEDQHLPVAPQLLPKLVSGNPQQATQAIEIASRRLRSSGLEPVMPSNQLPDLVGIDSRRLAATLLIPLNFGAIGAMARAVLKFEQDVHVELP